ncbi:transcriptional regulator [Caulobacter phage CcrBL10]|uniref:Uncharacterized protein n=1 Tax=Caulobacter phage CcrBL10 TaxID=2283269 RepID=A0A385ECC9_9CAUD|nr:transcriptional regulator [Caulobacter phage CcrBL10]AXQ68467.1 hypothetical protein CcrBL10_gp263 [Caulobacter phage CcrBL10]
MKPLDERIREAIATPRPAWIEKKGDRFHVITKGVLFPNTRNALSKSWSRRAGALACIRQDYLTLLEGDCPLPEVTQAQRDAYQFQGAERREAVEALSRELGIHQDEIRRALRNLEGRGLIRFEAR